MRLWSLDPETLDRAALIACWREGLLARRVLLGLTRGYRSHPQLERFRDQPDPIAAIDAYLHGIRDEATRRGYRFDPDKLGARITVPAIPVTTGQLAFELEHLERKVSVRDPGWLPRLRPGAHPLFAVRDGPIASWERAR